MSAACNPYLAFGAYVMAGLDGIKKKLEPGEPNLGNMYDLGLAETDRKFHWPLGRRPDDHPGLSELGL